MDKLVFYFSFILIIGFITFKFFHHTTCFKTENKEENSCEIKQHYRITTNGKQYRVEKCLLIIGYEGDRSKGRWFSYSPYYTELKEAQEALAEALEEDKYQEWKPIDDKQGKIWR